MKIYLKFAAIPLAAFTLLFALPRLFAWLFNMHSDFGIVAIVTIVCLIFSAVGAKIYLGYIEFSKDYNDNER